MLSIPYPLDLVFLFVPSNKIGNNSYLDAEILEMGYL